MAEPRPDDDDIPEVLPAVESFGGLTPMAKWAGQPADGNSGVMTSSPKDDTYDPMRKPSAYAEVGSSGLAQYGGFVRDEFLTQLQGDNWLKTVREMIDNDSVIGAMLFAIQMMVRKVDWHVEPPEAASVEDIVNERIEERAQRQAEQQQAQQQKMMMAQAGLAQNPGQGAHSGSNAPGKPGQTPPPPSGPRPGLTQGHQPSPFHQPVNKAAGSAAPGQVDQQPETAPTAGASSPGSQPGVNPAEAAGQPSAANPAVTPGPGSGQNPQDAQDPQQAAMAAMGLGGQPQELDPEERKGLELAVFVETCIHDLDVSWADLLSQIVTFIFFGFAAHEIIYKKRQGPNVDMPWKGSRFDDGKIGWAKLAGRAQETRFRWEFDPDTGDVIGMWQLAPPKFQMKYLPLNKMLLFRTTAYKGNPEGRSVVRPAYRSWYFKKRIEEYEAIGIERNLAGLPVAYVPYQMMSTSATAEERAALLEIKKIVRNLRRNEQEGVVFPNAFDPETKQKLYELTLLSPGGGGSSRVMDTDKVITRYEQRMAMVALADFMMLGHDGVGARSLGETKTSLFSDALTAFLNIIADVFNTYAIPRLLQMNGEDPALAPKLTFTKIEEVTLEEIASFITSMANAGADLFPDTVLEDALRDRAGLPPKMASEDL